MEESTKSGQTNASSFDLALIFSLLGILAQRAGNGSREASEALRRVQEVLRQAVGNPWLPSDQAEWARGGPRDRVWNEWEELQVREGLLIILDAAEGRPGYPIETLREVGLQVLRDCEEVGSKAPPVDFLWEGK